MRKFNFLMLSFILLFGSLAGTAGAEASNDIANYSEQQLDETLLEAGTPPELINQIELDTKRQIVENGGEDFNFSNTFHQSFSRDDESGDLVPQNEMTEGVAPLNIPRSDLVFNIYSFEVYVNGVLNHDVYADFEWLQSGTGPSTNPQGVVKDIISIAIPDGWEIQAGDYHCALYSSMFTGGIGWGAWAGHGTEGCGDNNGDPHSSGYSLYGAAWQLGGANYISSPLPRVKGTVKLRMKKVDPNAVNRVIVKYMEAKNNILGNFTFGLAWGALSVSFNGSSGSVNEASQDGNI